jgi:hypothetical protein
MLTGPKWIPAVAGMTSFRMDTCLQERRPCGVAGKAHSSAYTATINLHDDDRGHGIGVHEPRYLQLLLAIHFAHLGRSSIRHIDTRSAAGIVKNDWADYCRFT